MDQFPALTSLRFLAALLVFLFHFPPTGAFWEIVAGEGHVGVNIFFVLSGFLITLRYSEEVTRGTIRFADYFIRRAARILPLYYTVFCLSVWISGGDLFSLARLPEWTLTQAIFAESVQVLAVPTSWSLTVEECFYALAPVLFLLLARVRRRAPGRPLLASAGVLLLVVVVLLAAGAAIWTVLGGRGPGHLRSAQLSLTNTIFGRFYDFALGIMAAITFRSPWGGRARQWLARPAMAAALSLAGGGMIFVAQRGMHLAGGIYGPHWVQVWGWNFLLAPGAAALIVSLTSAGNPVARALALSPFVYLGKVSYALYLVQLAPLGRGLFFWLLPREGWLALLGHYLGQTAISVALYELVEYPARGAVVRLAGLEKRRAEPPPASYARARLVTAAVIAATFTTQLAAWVVTSLPARFGPVAYEELQAASVDPRDVIVERANRWKSTGELRLVEIPRRWREGWGSLDRVPGALYVFVDGVSVPFSRQAPESSGPAAFFRGPQVSSLALRLPRVPGEVVVVKDTLWIRVRVIAARLAASGPRTLELLLLLGLLLVAALGALRGRSPSPRLALTAALALLVAWGLLELHELDWAPAVVAGECVLALLFLHRLPRVAETGISGDRQVACPVAIG